MKIAVVFLALVVAFAAASTCSVTTSGLVPDPPCSDLPPSPSREFLKFEAKYGKHYASQEERAERYTVFLSNLRRVQDLNKLETGTVFGVTKFMDLTPEEFQAQYLMSSPFVAPQLESAPQARVAGTIPTNWDWNINKTGIVTPVKNQEQCGSCWAFSATETIESIWALAGHPLAVLAPQQIVDCDTVDQGCNGGWPYNAYAYVIKAGGLEAESSYPYKAVNGKCKFTASKVVAKISGWQYVSQAASTENTTMLNWAYTTSPLSVCVDAATWQFYNGGVLQKACGTEIDHCVQVTGFSIVDNIPVWNVRNSWGTDWGVQGFIYIKRNMNLCAIATVVTVPKV